MTVLPFLLSLETIAPKSLSFPFVASYARNFTGLVNIEKIS